MFTNKHNPDIINNFNIVNKIRKEQKFNIENNPYKMIVEDNKIDEKNVIETFNKEVNKRNLKKKINKNNIKLENNLNISLDSFNDFDDLKNESKSNFEEKKKEIQKDRNKFNNILSSLIDIGII